MVELELELRKAEVDASGAEIFGCEIGIRWTPPSSFNNHLSNYKCN
jgi:hypothetical protein